MKARTPKDSSIRLKFTTNSNKKNTHQDIGRYFYVAVISNGNS